MASPSATIDGMGRTLRSVKRGIVLSLGMPDLLNMEGVDILGKGKVFVRDDALTLNFG